MSYKVDELFSFREYGDGYKIEDYLKWDDPSVTELEIPETYNGKPVTLIDNFCFYNSQYIKRVVIPPSIIDIDNSAFEHCGMLESVELSEGLEYIGTEAFVKTGLKSVRLPKSLRELKGFAFWCCPELERVEFNSAPKIEAEVFGGCPKLPPEMVAIGLLRSVDIKRPVFNKDIPKIMPTNPFAACDNFRPEVFELLVKNRCFQSSNSANVFYEIIKNNRANFFPVAEQYGMLESAELVDVLLGYATENQRNEITAYLLDLKNRKFGFNGGSDNNDLEL